METTAKTLKTMTGFTSWITILLLVLSPLLQALGANGCGLLDPLTILKTIENEEDGETIHCVDIYKQPAFSHPELRNHTIQMRPTNLDPFGVKSRSYSNNSSSGLQYIQSWHKKGEFCPEGTIPILQSSTEDFPQKTPRHWGHEEDPSESGSKPPSNIREYAVAFLPVEDVQGVTGDINVWNPSVNWQKEYSAAQVWVTDGGGKAINTLEVGWLVTTDFKLPLLFIYWTTDGYGSTGCYNLCCGGFVQTSNKVVLGGRIEPFSKYGGAQRQITIRINRDVRTGNWWLTYQGIIVGYWPPSIFTGGLKSGSSLVEFGGEVVNSDPTGFHTSTDMGSGHFPSEGFGKAAFFKNLVYLTRGGVAKDADTLQGRAARPECYDVAVQKSDTDYGAYFYYGGPGFSRYCKY